MTSTLTPTTMSATASPVPLVAKLGPNPRAVADRWLSVVSHTDPRYGGLSSAVPRAGLSAAATGRVDMNLAAFCAPGEQVRPAGYDDAHLSFWPVGRRPWLTESTLRGRFRELVGGVDGLHIHGLWEASTMTAGRTARALKKPYVLSAHGMLEPWALANKRWKKQIYAALIERNIVGGAACLVALTKAEAEQYRAFGARCPVAVIPNGVDVPEALSPELFLRTHPELRGKRLVLFLGRLHPKKGLGLLVDAWAQVAGEYRDAHLVLAGPDAEGTRAKLVTAIATAGIQDRVTFTGMLSESLKWSALAAAECFVLPSFSEGLSMGVLEAMGAGVPVLVTHACNMPEISAVDAGWEKQPTEDAVRVALQQVLRQDPDTNRAVGRRGAHLVSTRYSRAHVAQATAEVYDFVLHGHTPARVVLQT